MMTKIVLLVAAIACLTSRVCCDDNNNHNNNNYAPGPAIVDYQPSFIQPAPKSYKPPVQTYKPYESFQYKPSFPSQYKSSYPGQYKQGSQQYTTVGQTFYGDFGSWFPQQQFGSYWPQVQFPGYYFDVWNPYFFHGNDDYSFNNGAYSTGIYRPSQQYVPKFDGYFGGETFGKKKQRSAYKGGKHISYGPGFGSKYQSSGYDRFGRHHFGYGNLHSQFGSSYKKPVMRKKY